MMAAAEVKNLRETKRHVVGAQAQVALVSSPSWPRQCLSGSCRERNTRRSKSRSNRVAIRGCSRGEFQVSSGSKRESYSRSLLRTKAVVVVCCTFGGVCVRARECVCVRLRGKWKWILKLRVHCRKRIPEEVFSLGFCERVFRINKRGILLCAEGS